MGGETLDGLVRKRRYALRCGGAFATYPIYKNGVEIAYIECYAEEADYWYREYYLKGIKSGNIRMRELYDADGECIGNYDINGNHIYKNGGPHAGETDL